MQNHMLKPSTSSKTFIMCVSYDLVSYREVHEVVTLNMDVQSQDWDDLSTIKSSTSSLTTVTEVSIIVKYMILVNYTNFFN